MAKPYEIATQGVRAGIARTEFQEHSEALFLTSSFVFKNAKFGGTLHVPFYDKDGTGDSGWDLALKVK